MEFPGYRDALHYDLIFYDDYLWLFFLRPGKWRRKKKGGGAENFVPLLMSVSIIRLVVFFFYVRKKGKKKKKKNGIEKVHLIAN